MEKMQSKNIILDSVDTGTPISVPVDSIAMVVGLDEKTSHIILTWKKSAPLEVKGDAMEIHNTINELKEDS